MHIHLDNTYKHIPNWNINGNKKFKSFNNFVLNKITFQFGQCGSSVRWHVYFSWELKVVIKLHCTLSVWTNNNKKCLTISLFQIINYTCTYAQYIATVDGFEHQTVNNQVGLGDTDNTTLWLLQKNHCDHCHSTALEYFITINMTQHHYTCVPLETAIASLSIGMNLWVSIVVVGKNLIGTLYCSIMRCIMWQCSVIYWKCDIIEMWKCLRYWYWHCKVAIILIYCPTLVNCHDSVVYILSALHTVWVRVVKFCF